MTRCCTTPPSAAFCLRQSFASGVCHLPICADAKMGRIVEVLLCRDSPPDKFALRSRGLAMDTTAAVLVLIAVVLGGAIGSALFGPLVDHGWHRLFLAICGVSLLVLGGFAVRLLEVSPADV